MSVIITTYYALLIHIQFAWNHVCYDPPVYATCTVRDFERSYVPANKRIDRAIRGYSYSATPTGTVFFTVS